MMLSPSSSSSQPPPTIATSTAAHGTNPNTTFKVVEFYRNNNRALVNNTNNRTTSNQTNQTQTSNANLYDILGFEIIGGYLADVPATIVNVASNAANHNRKEVKVK